MRFKCISNKNSSLTETNLKDTIIIRNITFKLGVNKNEVYKQCIDI